MANAVARARARAAGTPLRVRLVAILLLLALLALAVTGAVAVTLLRGQLVDKVDAQVTSVARGFVPGGDTRGRGERGLLPTTQPSCGWRTSSWTRTATTCAGAAASSSCRRRSSSCCGT